MKKLLNSLVEKGKERVRLTRQLQQVLSRVAEDMANALDERVSIRIDDYKIFVREYESNIGTYKTIVFSSFDDDNCEWLLGAITDLTIPGEFVYLHNDFRCTVRVAPRNVFLYFANHLDKIVKEFELKQDTIIESLKGALAKLEDFANAKAES